MLVLTRKVGERLTIGDNVQVVVQRIGGGKVRLGVEAPSDVAVLRGELAPFRPVDLTPPNPAAAPPAGPPN